MDVHNRKSPRQNGPRLPKTHGQIRPNSKSQNLCDEVLVPRHRGFDRLDMCCKTGRSSGGTRTSMLRGTPGWRRMRPARSRLRTILVDGGRGYTEVALHLALSGRASMHARVGVDEGHVLALLGREA